MLLSKCDLTVPEVNNTSSGDNTKQIALSTLQKLHATSTMSRNLFHSWCLTYKIVLSTLS